MANAQQQQDVIVHRDSHGHIIVDRYAKALEILDGDKHDCWKYEMHHVEGFSVHYAELLGDRRLEVKGAQPVNELSQLVNYNVYLDLKLEDGAVGFDHPMMFEFTDQQGHSKPFPYKLQAGDNMVHVGQFVATPFGSPNVTVKMSDKVSVMKKKGLLVRRMRITTA